MAKKTNDAVNLIDSFAEFKETKNIDRATLVSVLEEYIPQHNNGHI